MEELTTPENERRLNQLLELEGVESAGENMGRGLTRGMISYAAQLNSGLREGQVDAAMAQISNQLAEQLEEEIAPVLIALAASMTAASLEVVGSPESREQMATIAASVAEAVMVAMAVGLQSELGPALADVIVDDLGPAITEMLDDDFNQALGHTARIVSEEIATGASEGLFETEVSEPDDPTLMERLGQQAVGLSESLGWLFWILVAVSVALFVGVIAWIVRLVFESRDVKKKSDQRGTGIERLEVVLERIDEDPKLRRLLESFMEEGVDLRGDDDTR